MFFQDKISELPASSQYFAQTIKNVNLGHSCYWPSLFAYTKVPESDYLEKSQKTLGVFW